MQACGASRPRLRLASVLRWVLKKSASEILSLSFRSRTRRSGRRSRTTRSAKAMALARRSPVAISSMSPVSCAWRAPIGSPPVIMSSASGRPTSRGRRCVPPAPGRMPSFTSGSPTLASATAMRKWQDSASSRPPPSAVPCIAAITGFGLFSMVSMMARRPGSFIGLPNSVMSAPATKVRPAQISTIAFAASSAMAALTPAWMPARSAWLSALTGGLSMVRTATAPTRSLVTIWRGSGMAFPPPRGFFSGCLPGLGLAARLSSSAARRP